MHYCVQWVPSRNGGGGSSPERKAHMASRVHMRFFYLDLPLRIPLFFLSFLAFSIPRGLKTVCPLADMKFGTPPSDLWRFCLLSSLLLPVTREYCSWLTCVHALLVPLLLCFYATFASTLAWCMPSLFVCVSVYLRFAAIFILDKMPLEKFPSFPPLLRLGIYLSYRRCKLHVYAYVSI